MRAVLGTIVVMLLTVGLAAHADTTYNIYTFNGSQTSGSVMIGRCALRRAVTYR